MSTNLSYTLVTQSNQSTVVSQYVPEAMTLREASYQSEAELERAFIKQLQALAYEYLHITTESDLIANLRRQLEKLNQLTFTDDEWQRFFSTELTNPNQSITEKTKTIQEDYIKHFIRDDGSVKNIYLLRKDKIHTNTLQVINQ